MEGEQFLQKKFQDLHNTEEVLSAVRRREVRTHERVPQKSVERIRVYLDRFREVIERDNPAEKERGIQAFKKVFYEENIIAPENIPDRAYTLEQEIALEQGHGRIEITDAYKQNKAREIVSGQVNSLNAWVDYLASEDAPYPMWEKYWALASVIKLGRYNKQKGVYEKRGKNAVAPFPPCIGAALSRVFATQEAKLAAESVENFSALDDETFQRVLERDDFSKLYALAIESIPEFSEEGLENIRGEWRCFSGVADADALFDSLQGYPLEWCTAGNVSTAETQLQGGDFYVYYSENTKGENVVPRVAIRMEGDTIAEVRGAAPHQEIDKFIGPVVDEKMNEFGDEGVKYKQRVADMKRLTSIHERVCSGKQSDDSCELTYDELVFLYGVERKIEGFGFQSDPRISEILKVRPVSADIAKILETIDKTEQAALRASDAFTLAIEQRTTENKVFSYNQAGGLYSRPKQGGPRLDRQQLMSRVIENVPATAIVELMRAFDSPRQVLDAFEESMRHKSDYFDVHIFVTEWRAMSEVMGVLPYLRFLFFHIEEYSELKRSFINNGELMEAVISEVGFPETLRLLKKYFLEFSTSTHPMYRSLFSNPAFARHALKELTTSSIKWYFPGATKRDLEILHEVAGTETAASIATPEVDNDMLLGSKWPK